MIRQRRTAPRRGAAAVELAVLAPILVFFLLGLWEIGRIVHLQQIVANAAREGARQAAAGKKTKAQIQDVVLDYLDNAGLRITDPAGSVNVTVVVTNETTDGEVKGATQPDGTIVPQGAVQNDRVRVEVAYPYANASWLTTTFFVPDTANLNAAAEWVSIVDQPINVSAEIPRQPR